MTNFIALYRGATISDAKMIAVSADPDLTAYVATQILSEAQFTEELEEPDPVLSALRSGRRRALRLVSETEGE